MRRAFLTSMGTAGVALLARDLLARSPTGPSRTAHRISPFDFGARGDGVHDDTLACIQAAREADRRRAWLVFPKGHFVITGEVSISGALAGVIGEGGRIRLQSSQGRAGLLIRNLTEVDPVGKPFLIADLQIDCRVSYGDQAAALYAIDVQGVHFVNNSIHNVQVGRGIYLRGTRTQMQADGSTPAVAFNVLRNNVIDLNPLPRQDCFGIEIETERLPVEGEHSPRDIWLRHFSLPLFPVPAHDNVLEGNRVSGGYYGISFLGVRRSLLRNNVLVRQVRSISLQHQSNANLVVHNVLKDSLSSSVHLAYGASDNVVGENRIQTTRARGEGLLQAYVQASRNDFYMNDVQVLDGGEPKYLMYCGVASNENAFWCNRLWGRASRACIAIESAFNSREQRRSHRNFGMGDGDDHFTDRGMYGIRIVGNEIRAQGDTPVLTLAQVGDRRGDYPLLMCEVLGNHVTWSGRGLLLELAESKPGALRDIVWQGNVIDPVPGRQQLQLPRGGRHFSMAVDRSTKSGLPDI